MRPFLALSASLLGPVLVTGVMVAAISNAGSQGAIYTVGEVQANLARSPSAWVGRTILVQGTVVAGNPVDHRSLNLVDVDALAVVDPLLLVRLGPDPLRAFLRRLPSLGSLAPAAQTIHWDEVAVYLMYRWRTSMYGPSARGVILRGRCLAAEGSSAAGGASHGTA
jgi:hypothetical protein